MMGRLRAAALAVMLLTAGATSTAMAQAVVPAGGAASGGAGGAATWQIDVAHSELTFRVRHLVSRVRGHFRDWQGTIVADPNNLTGGSVQVEIRTASIDTNHERRDNHLRSNDFFDAERHPAITFRSSRVELNGERIRVHGDLTMRGVTRPVVLEGTYLGISREPSGRERMGFEAQTTVNRHDYNVSWNRAAEGGGLVLGDEVTISIVVAAVRG
jgi:polyisoprenoid-binding protein YceI